MSNVRPLPPHDNAADDDAFKRVPPQDLDAEAAVLGGMQSGRAGIEDAARILTPAEFYKPAHETIYRAILDLNAKGEPVDPITLGAELGRRDAVDLRADRCRQGGPDAAADVTERLPDVRLRHARRQGRLAAGAPDDRRPVGVADEDHALDAGRDLQVPRLGV